MTNGSWEETDKVVRCSAIYFREAVTTRRWGGSTIRDRIDLDMADSIEVNLTWRVFRVTKQHVRPNIEGPLETVKQWDVMEPEPVVEPDVPALPPRKTRARASATS